MLIDGSFNERCHQLLDLGVQLYAAVSLFFGVNLVLRVVVSQTVLNHRDKAVRVLLQLVLRKRVIYITFRGQVERRFRICALLGNEERRCTVVAHHILDERVHLGLRVSLALTVHMVDRGVTCQLLFDLNHGLVRIVGVACMCIQRVVHIFLRGQVGGRDRVLAGNRSLEGHRAVRFNISFELLLNLGHDFVRVVRSQVGVKHVRRDLGNIVLNLDGTHGVRGGKHAQVGTRKAPFPLIDKFAQVVVMQQCSRLRLRYGLRASAGTRS